MNAQLEIDYCPPAVDPVDDFCAWLDGKGWVRAAEIASAYGRDERSARELAEHAGGRILTGQKGYRLNDDTATAEEVNRSARWKIAQGKKMVHRGIAELRHHHRLVGRP